MSEPRDSHDVMIQNFTEILMIKIITILKIYYNP